MEIKDLIKTRRLQQRSLLSGKWSALTVPCDLKIKNARPNKCFGGLRRTCQTYEQEQKGESTSPA